MQGRIVSNDPDIVGDYHSWLVGGKHLATCGGVHGAVAD